MSPDEMNRGERLWLALLVAGSVAFSLGFACATPLAAFAAAAALTLPRKQALVLTGAVWLANQIVGFGFLGYPWDGNTLAWGVGLGAAALIGTLAARGALLSVRRAGRVVGGLAAFVAAFAAYEAALFALAAGLLGGAEDFTVAILARVLEINAVAFVGLVVLNEIAMRLGLARRGSAVAQAA